MKKTLGLLLFSIIIYYIWYVHFNYRFEEISEKKVYKSALIKPDKLSKYLKEYKIKTVIDLLDAGVQDRLNPAKQKHIDAEDQAIKQYNKEYKNNVKHINIPSGQVPTKKTLTAFYEILDDKTNYPVLIHCYHGTGRAAIYSAIYRIEYENWKNKDARAKTRVVVEGFGYRSSFADGKSKGDFLMNYSPRKNKNNSTIEELK
jgi:protein-tyrosine phosphatase